MPAAAAGRQCETGQQPVICSRPSHRARFLALAPFHHDRPLFCLSPHTVVEMESAVGRLPITASTISLFLLYSAKESREPRRVLVFLGS